MDATTSLSDFLYVFLANCTMTVGTGDPENAVAATPGSIFMRLDGGVGATLYVKESGTGNTGWAAK